MKRPRALTLSDLRKIGVLPAGSVSAGLLSSARPIVLLREGALNRLSYRKGCWEEAEVLCRVLSEARVEMRLSLGAGDLAPGTFWAGWHHWGGADWEMNWASTSSRRALLEVLFRVLATAGLPCPLAVIREWFPGADLMGTQLALLQRD